MPERVRALLITPDNQLLTIMRVRAGRDPYLVLPGGGVEPGEDHQAALARELREELSATAEIGTLIHVYDYKGQRQYIYLARALTWSAEGPDPDSPEFSDPARGEYHLQSIPLTVRAISRIGLEPESLRQILLRHLGAGQDLFALPEAGVPTEAAQADGIS